MEDMPWGLIRFHHYICMALDHWGYEFDGSKVRLAIDTMLGEMTEKDVRHLVDFVEELDEETDEEYMKFTNYDPVGQYLLEAKYALGFVMMISEEYAVQHFNDQLEEMK